MSAFVMHGTGKIGFTEKLLPQEESGGLDRARGAFQFCEGEGVHLREGRSNRGDRLGEIRQRRCVERPGDQEERQDAHTSKRARGPRMVVGTPG